MLTKTEALALVTSRLQLMSASGDSYVVVEESTIEKPFGWVFFYNSKKFLETGISRYRLAGNGPVIVNRTNGTLEFCGINRPPEELIRDYEKGLSAEKRSV